MRTTGTFRRLRNRVRQSRDEIATPVPGADPQPFADATVVVARNVRQLMDRSKSLKDVQALSERSGVSEMMLGKLLQHEGALCANTLDRIAAAFGVPTWTLVHRDWDRKRREAELLDSFLREMRK